MNCATALLRPDSILHIYYLEGIISLDYVISHPAFLGNWEEDEFSFLFFLEAADETVGQVVEDHNTLQLVDQYEMSYADWQGGSIDPVQIGRFVLQPSWSEQQVEPGQIAISLNPGVVFGNGAHPTTRDCLEAIEIASMGGKVKTMLDLGTGTGILAIAAAKLGCEKCLAVDFNHLAAQTAQANVVLNQLEPNIQVVSGRAEQLIARPTDLMVANIHYAVMKDIVASEGFLQQKWFVLSGLLSSEAEKISAHLKTLPVSVLKHWKGNGVWHTFLGVTHKD
ncbi:MULTISPECIES: 50S ribosomal protein L11 methyltransferase [Desulfosediminicola]|uniref:50S ribosomal protein L11 methyltransferase n=1 Tax=Desulfosediminicola TaxID=2886823 RepID=UPI0010AD0817|nr:50S ribosomal protein L11 methyltransferase [Desulfosediminicola ganghwensis]